MLTDFKVKGTPFTFFLETFLTIIYNGVAHFNLCYNIHGMVI